MNITLESSKLYPLKFMPIYMERIWGGNMMSEVLGRTLPEHSVPIGESWELVDRDGEESVVLNGELAGCTLHELIEHYRGNLLGRAGKDFVRFPLLVKIIDAGERLSLQVHPDEQACREIGNGAEPKTEMWYVIAAESGAEIMAGLNGSATKVRLKDVLDYPDEVESMLQIYNSQPGDAYYIASGTLHAIGAGNLILEIQQNSDTTYRVNDWGRLGPDGKPRELHREVGLKSINFTNRTSPRIAGVVGETGFNRKYDVVKLCPFFQVADLRLCSVWNDSTGSGESFHLLSAVNGCVEVGRDERTAVLLPGETALIPGCFGAYYIKPLDGKATVVKTTL
ncbi:MAG: class I mannose-6-phosphate isomerase [Lentisphaeria bacterium]|nr:class I mannose-6-phosphate isomerase [Lentisphaeria bacterium]